jgi:signal transduction histidine kinase
MCSQIEPAGGAAAAPDKASARRWLRWLAIATISVIVVLSLGERPSPALQGGGLSVSIALLALLVSTAALLRHSGGTRWKAAALAAVILASSALVWTQHGGAGVAGLFFAVAYAGMSLPARGSLAILALAAVTLGVAAGHAHGSLAGVLGQELGLLAFYVIAVFARRAEEAHEQTKQLLAELEASRYSREEAAALRERSRIAREMHDVLAHSLSGLMLQLEGARMLASMPDSNGQLPVALDRAHHLARAGVDEARRAIAALRDEDLPGPDRLEQLTADFCRDSGVDARLEITGAPHQLDSQTSLTLFRVAQEALTNSRKHGRPERIELHLGYEPGGTRLVVQDHVCEPQTRGTTSHELRPPAGDGGGELSGYGLTGMRERAELLGGRLEASSTNDGFRVELWVPA